MPFVFYNAAAPGGRLAVLGPDQSTIDVELRDVPSPTADTVPYSPSDALAWTVPPPDDVAEALNELAATGRGAFLSHTIVTPATPTPYIFDGAFFNPIKSGRFLVWCVAGGTINSAQACYLQLRTDGSTVANSIVRVNATTSMSINMSTFQLVTLDRTTTHTVGAEFGFGAGTISGQGFMRFLSFEL
jgi:hypothetical protein